MCKNKQKTNQFYLYINGKAISVSEEVYRTYKHHERKEEYFSDDLKKERFKSSTSTFLPSREDSYERLQEINKQFVALEKSVEQQVIDQLEIDYLKEALSLLEQSERELINLLFYQEKTEYEVGKILHISQQAVNKRKQLILLKLKKILEKKV